MGQFHVSGQHCPEFERTHLSEIGTEYLWAYSVQLKNPLFHDLDKTCSKEIQFNKKGTFAMNNFIKHITPRTGLDFPHL